MAITKYDLDINKQAIIKPVVILRQGDHDIDTMQVSLSVANEPMDLTGATVTFMGNTANGRQIIDDAHVKIIDAKGGVFEYVFPSQASSDIGEYKVAYFSIILGNGQSSTMDFRVQVLSGVDISAPVASEYITHYDTMVSNLNSAYDSATKATNQKMASTVSSLATSAATVLDSALARVNTVNSTANSASSAASRAVSMASSVATTVTSQASYINSVASSAASNVSSVAAGVVDKLNNISVGVRNYALNTANPLTINGTGASNEASSDNTTNPAGRYYINADVLGKQTIVSYDLTLDTDMQSGSTISLQVYNYAGNWDKFSKQTGLKAGTTHVSFSWNAPKKNGLGKFVLRGVSDGYTGKITISNFSVVLGNIATDWTPAPEDADNAYVEDTRLASGITDFNLVMGKTWSGKWYKAGAHWSNEPTGVSPYLQFEYTPGDNDKSGILEIRDWVNNRYWIRSVSGGKWSNWVELANDANVVHKTGNETIAGDKTFTGKVAVSGTLDAAQKIYTRTIGTTNDLQIIYTRVGSVVTGRYKAKFAGTFPLGGNDGYKSTSGYPVNITAGGGVDAWFTEDNKFVTKGANEGNFMFITSDPLPSN